MYLINVAVSYGGENYNPGDVAALSDWPPADIDRLKREYRPDIGRFVIESQSLVELTATEDSNDRTWNEG
jgi:hypothetical protein